MIKVGDHPNAEFLHLYLAWSKNMDIETWLSLYISKVVFKDRGEAKVIQRTLEMAYL